MTSTDRAATAPGDPLASIPPDLRADWQEYQARTVDDMCRARI
jgi:hypothetical protein